MFKYITVKQPPLFIFLVFSKKSHCCCCSRTHQTSIITLLSTQLIRYTHSHNNETFFFSSIDFFFFLFPSSSFFPSKVARLFACLRCCHLFLHRHYYCIKHFSSFFQLHHDILQFNWFSHVVSCLVKHIHISLTLPSFVLSTQNPLPVTTHLNKQTTTWLISLSFNRISTNIRKSRVRFSFDKTNVTFI